MAGPPAGGFIDALDLGLLDHRARHRGVDVLALAVLAALPLPAGSALHMSTFQLNPSQPKPSQAAT